jgi:hypothetical protein
MFTCRWLKCYHILIWFFLPKPGFLKFIWIFSGKNHLKINISPTFWIQISPRNSIKSCSSRSFQDHQRHIPVPPKFQLRFNLVFSGKNHSYSRISTPPFRDFGPVPTTETLGTLERNFTFELAKGTNWLNFWYLLSPSFSRVCGSASISWLSCSDSFLYLYENHSIRTNACGKRILRLGCKRNKKLHDSRFRR